MSERTRSPVTPAAPAGPDSGTRSRDVASRGRVWPVWLLTLLAVGYLAAMVVTGALPRQRQLIEFEARGPMRETPESVLRVEVNRGGDRRLFVRDATGGWIVDGGGPIAPEAARQVSMAVQFLNTSAPLRHLAQRELVGMTPAAFGLDPPLVAASLHGAQGPLIAVNFGAENPEGTARYMSVDGRDGVYLISRFVANEWATIAQILPAR